MGTVKDRNDKDLTEAEEFNNRWQEHTEELYKKGLNDPGNHDGVVTHLQPDILEDILRILSILSASSSLIVDRYNFYGLQA